MRKKVVSLLIDTCLSGKQLSMSPGCQKIDIVHIDDVVRAYENALCIFNQTQLSGEYREYAVSSGVQITLKDLAGIVEKVSGKNIDILWGGFPYREREVMIPWTAFNPVPGWFPEIDLESGIRELYTEALKRMK